MAVPGVETRVLGTTGLRRVVQALAPISAALAVLTVRLGAFHSFLSSDSLIAADAARDLLDGRIRGWVFAPAPFFFPDIAVSAALRAASPSTSFVYLAYPFVMALAFYGVARGIASVLASEISPTAQHWAASAGVLLMTWSVPSRDSGEVLPLLPVLFGPAWHGGALLFSLAILLWSHRALTTVAPSRRHVAGVFALIALGVPSDRLVLAQAVLPVLAVSALVFVRARSHADREGQLRSGLWIVICALGSVVGLVLESAVWEFGMGIGGAGQPVLRLAGIQRALKDLLRLTMGYPNWGLSVVVLGASAAVLRRKRPKASFSPLALLLGCSVVFSFLTTAALGYEELSHVRRMLPVFAIPMLWAPIALANVLRMTSTDTAMLRRKLAMSAAVVGSAVVPIATALGNGSGDVAKFSLDYPQKLRCLDELHREGAINVGLSDYWNARLFRSLSTSDLQLTALWTTGPIFRSTQNLRPLLTNERGRTPVSGDTVDFILPQRIDRGGLRSLYGAPDRTKMCGDLEVWLYNRGRLTKSVNSLKAEARETIPNF
jgi:hypothetical protein